jgi:release factor glutamine methyltransferase
LATIKSILQESSLDRIDARILLHYICNKYLDWDKTKLITNDLEELPLIVVEEWQALEAARKNGSPVAYLIQHKAFHGIELFVNEDVLIPRPETELLVDSVIQFVEDAFSKHTYSPKNPFRILDMGTGSGAILLALAKHFHINNLQSCFEFLGLDKSQDAIEVARKNAKLLNLTNVQFIQSNWFSELAPQLFHCIVSNPPYIAKGDPHLVQGDLRFEPKLALTDDADGLAEYQTIFKNISTFIHSNGKVFFEHGLTQGSSIRDLFYNKSFINVQTLRDLSGNERITCGIAPI